MRSAMPIAWHEECYANAAAHHLEQMRKLEHMTKMVTESAKWLDEYRALIDSAKRDGRKSFDSDRYRGKSRRKSMKT